MATLPVTQRILEQVARLDERRQRQVLDYARSLSTPSASGEPGKHLLEFVGAIASTDLQEMAEAIEEGCEKVDPNGW